MKRADDALAASNVHELAQNPPCTFDQYLWMHQFSRSRFQALKYILHRKIIDHASTPIRQTAGSGVMQALTVTVERITNFPGDLDGSLHIDTKRV